MTETRSTFVPAANQLGLSKTPVKYYLSALSAFCHKKLNLFSYKCCECNTYFVI